MNDKILTIKKSTLVDIANQVRAKTGSTDLIKVADLDDAVKELSGGGIVEVDVLPEIFFAGDSIPVPSSQIERKPFTYEDGYVENIAMPTGESVKCDSLVFNTSLSIDEVVNEIKKVSVDMDNTYAVNRIGCSFIIECYGNNNEYLMNINIQNIINGSYVDGTFVSNHSDDYCIGYNDGISGESFYIFNTQDGGWNQEFINTFNGVIEIPQNTTHVIAYIGWPDAENEAKYGFMSDKSKDITNLVMAAELVKNPEFNAEAIYKLPDETLWMYEDGWKKLAKQKKVTIINDAGCELTFGVYPDCENLVSEDMRDFNGTINQVTLPENGKLELYVTASVAIYNSYGYYFDDDKVINARHMPIDEEDGMNDVAELFTLTGDNAVIHIDQAEM